MVAANMLYITTQKTFRHRNELLVTYRSSRSPVHNLSSYMSDTLENRLEALTCCTVTADSWIDRWISNMTVWITIHRSLPAGCFVGQYWGHLWGQLWLHLKRSGFVWLLLCVWVWAASKFIDFIS